MLPRGITVFTLDFAGSGLSDGDWVTLGAHEVDDLATAVEYLRAEGSTSMIALWGRSMGAVTAIIYSSRDPTIAAVVADSPFSRLTDLMMELATNPEAEGGLNIPKPLVKVALSMMRRSVRRRAEFLIDDVAPLDIVPCCFVPCLLGHGMSDTFVAPHHSERLFVEHGAETKNFVPFDGDHNGIRPEFFYDSALIFLLNALRVEEQVGPHIDLRHIDPKDAPHLAISAPNSSIYVARTSSVSSSTQRLGSSDEGVGAVKASDGSVLEEDATGISDGSNTVSATLDRTGPRAVSMDSGSALEDAVREEEPVWDRSREGSGEDVGDASRGVDRRHISRRHRGMGYEVGDEKKDRGGMGVAPKPIHEWEGQQMQGKPAHAESHWVEDDGALKDAVGLACLGWSENDGVEDAMDAEERMLQQALELSLAEYAASDKLDPDRDMSLRSEREKE